MKTRLNGEEKISVDEIKLLESKKDKAKGEFGGKCKIEIKKSTSQYQLSADGKQLRMFTLSKNGQIEKDNTYSRAAF